MGSIETSNEQPGQRMSHELMNAAIAGDAARVTAILARGDKPQPDSLGQTPLIVAAIRGHAEAVAALAPASDLEAVSRVSGLTALGEALRRKNRSCAAALLDAGASPNAFDPETGASLLMRAIENRSAEWAKTLLRQPSVNLEQRDFQGKTALAWAAKEMPGFVKFLLTFGVDVNAADKKGQTPLMVAVMGKSKIGLATLRLVSDEKKQDLTGRTAFDLAALAGFEEGVEALSPTASLPQLRAAIAFLKHLCNDSLHKTRERLAQEELFERLGKEARQRAATASARASGQPLLASAEDAKALADALRKAARDADAKTLQGLLDRGAACAPDSLGYTPLIVAAKHGNAEGLKALLPFSDPNGRSRISGMTALEEAIKTGQDECVEILAPFADFSARSPDTQRTLLTTVAMLGQGRWVEEFLPKSDFLALDSNGHTALMHAARAGCARSVQALLPFVDPLAQDPAGEHALHFSIGGGKPEVAALLAAHGGATLASSRGDTPLMKAINERKHLVARALAPFSDLEQTDRAGRAAVELAALLEHEETVAMLAKCLPPASQSARKAFKIALKGQSAGCVNALCGWSSKQQAQNAIKKFGPQAVPAALARVEAMELRKVLKESREEGRSQKSPAPRKKPLSL